MTKLPQETKDVDELGRAILRRADLQTQFVGLREKFEKLFPDHPQIPVLEGSLTTNPEDGKTVTLRILLNRDHNLNTSLEESPITVKILAPLSPHAEDEITFYERYLPPKTSHRVEGHVIQETVDDPMLPNLLKRMEADHVVFVPAKKY